MTDRNFLQTEGELMGILLMLQQLYVLAAATHGGGEVTLSAWRADLEADLRKTTSAMAVGNDVTIETMSASALKAIEGVFGRIT